MDMIRVFNAETGKEMQPDPEAISTEKEPTIGWNIMIIFFLKVFWGIDAFILTVDRSERGKRWGEWHAVQVLWPDSNQGPLRSWHAL